MSGNTQEERTDPQPPVRFTTRSPSPSDQPREEQPVVEEQGIGIYVIIGESEGKFVLKYFSPAILLLVILLTLIYCCARNCCVDRSKRSQVTFTQSGSWTYSSFTRWTLRGTSRRARRGTWRRRPSSRMRSTSL